MYKDSNYVTQKMDAIFVRSDENATKNVLPGDAPDRTQTQMDMKKGAEGSASERRKAGAASI